MICIIFQSSGSDFDYLKVENLEFAGWPKLQWILTDSKHLAKVPSNWEPPARDADNQLAYIEYKTGQQNSVVGVAHSRTVIHNHCRLIEVSSIEQYLCCPALSIQPFYIISNGIT